MYEVALASGLRANELRTLTVGHLNVDRCGLRLDEEFTKNREAGFQPLPLSLVQRLKRDATGKQLTDPLLVVAKHTARDMDKDCVAAGIPKWLNGRKVDFHALRVAYISFVVAQPGVDLKTAQTLARHSDPKLTMNVYAQARPEKLAATVAGLGDEIFGTAYRQHLAGLTSPAEPIIKSTGSAVCVKTKTSLAGMHGNRTHQSPFRRTQRL